eukprot:m.380098 g.380098  ORF g.380098 m.380098 type:complete len:67 (+) comp102423_c0_seq1:162-362(+)
MKSFTSTLRVYEFTSFACVLPCCSCSCHSTKQSVLVAVCVHKYQSLSLFIAKCAKYSCSLVTNSMN